jgi:uncharacterized membrane protein YeiH/ABC-type nitrate/sulfonate/bicarbonate transport system substrate-binding protein
MSRRRRLRRSGSRVLGALCVALGCFVSGANAALANDPLRVQLNWYPQAEYAGLFVAQFRQYFREEGLDVTILPGGPDVDALARVQSGEADIAIDWLLNAVNRTRPDAHLVNVAQIYDGSGLVFICRRDSGVYTLSDLAGKTVGLWGIGDGAVLDAVLSAEGVDPSTVDRVRQARDGASLIRADAACVSATSYNEYWRIVDALEPEAIRVFEPARSGVFHIENGLYVLAERLQSEAFRNVLVRFVRALGKGWHDARDSHRLALAATQREVGEEFDAEHQQLMLESVLPLVSLERFGYLDPARFEAARDGYLDARLDPASGPIWTHAIWNRLSGVEASPFRLTAATKYYADVIVGSELFRLFMLLGIATFALSGIIEAVNRNFDLWGRLILAGVSCLGGGTLRDLLLGLEGPMFYVADPVIPTLVVALVIVVSALLLQIPELHHTAGWRRIKTVTDVLGFAILAIVGAQVAIAADAPLGWAPFCAALTCAGGGALRDIATISRPRTFRGVIYEEIAVVGGLVYVGLLILFQVNEHSVVPAVVSALSAMIVMVTLRTLVIVYELKYPAWLVGRGAA